MLSKFTKPASNFWLLYVEQDEHQWQIKESFPPILRSARNRDIFNSKVYLLRASIHVTLKGRIYVLFFSELRGRFCISVVQAVMYKLRRPVLHLRSSSSFQNV